MDANFKNGLIVLICSLSFGNVLGQFRSEKKTYYKHLYKKHGENLDTLINWVGDADVRLRLFSGTKLEELNRPEAIDGLFNSLNAPSYFPEKKGTVHIYSSLHQPPANGHLDALWNEDRNRVVSGAIQNLKHSKYGRIATLNYLIQKAKIDCSNKINESENAYKQCLEKISVDEDSLNYDLLKDASSKEVETYVESTLKPLLVEWFGELVPED